MVIDLERLVHRSENVREEYLGLSVGAARREQHAKLVTIEAGDRIV